MARFPKRLTPHPTDADWCRMAWAPSYRAPHPDEVLNPGPFTPPTIVPQPGWSERDWLAALEPWSAEDVVFRAGVPVACSLAGRAFISLGEPLLRNTPIRDVRLVAVQPYNGELAACPHLAMLHRLDLSGNWIGVDGVELLLASPHAAGVGEIDLRVNGLDDAAIGRLQGIYGSRVLLR
ncbi:MAG: hypothetical protein U0871_10025 [Gemmataceae bacterium]